MTPQNTHRRLAASGVTDLLAAAHKKTPGWAGRQVEGRWDGVSKKAFNEDAITTSSG